MTLLLDTNILLWWLEDSPRLPKRPRQLISRGGKVLVSAATVWEIAIKKALGKLKAPNSLEEALAESSFLELPITARHAESAAALPRYHDDPFDRMLVAQAQLEGLKLLTSDERLRVYGPSVLLYED
jgi:PIN domain nuclease of toxin-antitoxin system